MINTNLNQRFNQNQNSTGQPVNQIVMIKEKALQIVRTRGPLLPVQITKELGTNVMMASALLSELVDKKTVKLSNTKIGGSPLYYVTGQEPKLQSLRDKLNDKQQRAFDMLKRDKILRDAEQEPVIRLALRDIKDFAHQLNVTLDSRTEIFWKWYLTSDQEVEPLIKQKLNFKEKKETKKDDVESNLREIEENLKRLEEQKRDLAMPIEQKVKEEISKPIKIKKESIPRVKKEKIIQEQLPSATNNTIDDSDPFMVKVGSYFRQNNIELSDIKQIRRDSDFDGIVKIPSAVGSINYFCRAKNKQKITESDLSMLYAQSQMKKMPILLVTTGEVTKKAQNLLNKEFKNITIKTI